MNYTTTRGGDMEDYQIRWQQALTFFSILTTQATRSAFSTKTVTSEFKTNNPKWKPVIESIE